MPHVLDWHNKTLTSSFKDTVLHHLLLVVAKVFFFFLALLIRKKLSKSKALHSYIEFLVTVLIDPLTSKSQ